MGADALVDWLRGFLTKPDIDLLLDPSKKLTTSFLEDVAKAAEKKRIVLMLDTFEQMTAMEDWTGEVAHKIHTNVFMVVAGRKLPDWSNCSGRHIDKVRHEGNTLKGKVQGGQGLQSIFSSRGKIAANLAEVLRP